MTYTIAELSQGLPIGLISCIVQLPVSPTPPIACSTIIGQLNGHRDEDDEYDGLDDDEIDIELELEYSLQSLSIICGTGAVSGIQPHGRQNMAM